MIKSWIFAALLAFSLTGCKHSKVPVAYCHACRCGKEATKCINECNSPKICTIMCADKCNEKMSTLGAAPDLQWEFDETNVRYFGGSLPKTTVYRSHQKENEWIGITSPCGVKQYCIEINTRLAPAPREQDFTLMHEICHVKTFISDNGTHGPLWEQCMLDLANKGAFTGIW